MTMFAPGRTRVHRAGVDELDRVRAIRLRALADSPEAFWTTLAEAAAMAPETWRARLTDPAGATFLAVRDGAEVGLVYGFTHHVLLDEAGLYGMWVAPEARQVGVGRLLMKAVIAWARDSGYPQLRLEVADANTAAVATYRALGFTPTGRRGAMPAPREHILEHELALDLI